LSAAARGGASNYSQRGRMKKKLKPSEEKKIKTEFFFGIRTGVKKTKKNKNKNNLSSLL
jgi:hypothetical protein